MSSRVIFISHEQKLRFSPNVVRNQKYNVFTFIPCVLFEQFKQFLNFYFLIMAVSQFIPAIRVGYLSTYWGPLTFVIFVTLCREGFDDFRRHIRDREVNSCRYEKLTATDRRKVKSSQLQVGDLIVVHKNQRVPADMVLLRTSEKSGTCFIRTDQLDGETDWKLKVAYPASQHLDDDTTFQKLFSLNLQLYADKPQQDIHSFFGTIKYVSMIFLFSDFLRYPLIGVIIYTGSETRSALNTSQARSKIGRLDNEVNNLTKMLFVVVAVLALVMVCLKGFHGPWYLTYFRFVLLFSYIIPLSIRKLTSSLRVNLDMAKLVYSFLISRDKQIAGTLVRSSTIPEELGRISFLLCDKTGTLTQNNMAVEALVICNNVTPVTEESDNSSKSPFESTEATSYQASSPDEVALVSWANSMGLKLYSRDLHAITEEETKVITFFLKGADVVMKTKVCYNDWLEEECANLAREGLRTLVVAKSVLSDLEYEKFDVQYNQAKTSLMNRSMKIDAVMTSIERDMQLLCVTGVEDMLQTDVRVTLELLKNADIKVWMLTGDKLETALCIAKSSGIITRNQTVYTFDTVTNRTDARIELNNFSRKTGVAAVISGDSLKVLLCEYEEEFSELMSRSPAVVCCRCSPEQKAEIVRMLKKCHKTKLVAAVGDGGNDVSMIQAADAGIGIVGKEGKHASLAADFSINQFSFLGRLFLVHGRFCYKRSCSLAQFVIHRGLIISTMQAVFSCVFYFVSVSLYQGMLMVAYSTVYTMFPVFSLTMDQDVDDRIAMTYPEIYKELGKGRSLSLKTFFLWFLVSIYQGAVIMYGALVLFDADFIHIVSITFTSLILTELIMVALTVHKWHWAMGLAEVFSFLVYALSLLFLPSFFDIEFVRSAEFLWKTTAITAVSCVPLYVAKCLRIKCAPPIYTKLS
ncbi:unnamed protein product [Soboliphyme baturini]|uniref:Phospholipid-transporting ATPase n=1 Tax=Soboliphyme baturini TaxID=241478 RepID=A0A183IIP1_9BILA|nr:unnamed protein product [Soboliphyme baturini]